MPIYPGYYQIVANPHGGPLTLCANPDGTVACRPGRQDTRASKWSLAEAGDGYWLVGTAGVIQPGYRRLTNLDGTTDTVIVDSRNSASDAQFWSFATEGSVLRIRCAANASFRHLAGVSDGTPVFVGTNDESALTGWNLLPTMP
jgi:hypothetical protein